MNKIHWGKLLAAITICQTAGMIGSFFTISAISTWYQTLVKPSFSPPNGIFGPVWLVLYTLMGISLYLVWTAAGKKAASRKKEAIGLFLIQLFFNASWSIVFFGLKSPFFALVNILILLVLIVAVTYRFWNIEEKAGLLLLPYFAWVSFATILNYNIWILNR